MFLNLERQDNIWEWNRCKSDKEPGHVKIVAGLVGLLMPRFMAELSEEGARAPAPDNFAESFVSIFPL
jgi:hypothetical protein